MTALSICIPTYNFGPFIGQTLNSLLPQISTGVEVIILDGGSTDDTADVVASRQRNYPQLAYHRQNFRGGIDRDIEKVVSLAQGKYCWLFSADDIMLPGAINKVLEAIKSNDDVYLCEHILCTLEMKPIREHPPFNNMPHSKLFNLADILQRKEYFRSARTSEAFFSFMSGPIFKKEVWDSATIPESFRGTCWIVAGHLLSVIPKGLTVNYLSEKLIYKRGENDSFSDQGLVNRFRISIEGFRHVANVVFGEHTEEAFHLRRVIRGEQTLQDILRVKLMAAENPIKEDIKVLNRIVGMHYADSGLENWLKRELYRIAPVPVLRVVKSFKKYINNLFSVQY